MTVPLPTPRAPKQERSQRSWERVLACSAQLLADEGYEGFTLGKVSDRSGVSTGSIYGRVDSKDELVRVVHARMVETLDADREALFAEVRRAQTLAEVVPDVVHGIAELLRRHAAILRPMMLRAAYDEGIRSVGKASALRIRDDCLATVLAHRAEILHPRPERAASICYTLTYDTVARYLGLGSSLEAAGEGDWDELVADLADVFLRVLRSSGPAAS
jgi:AcrR family transcriptional regulator